MRLAKITLATLAIVIISGFAILAIGSGAATKEINFNAPKLQSKQEKLENLNVEYEKLNKQMLKLRSSDKEQIKKLDTEKQHLEQQRQELQKQLEAKAEQKRKIAEAAVKAENTLTATQTVSAAPAYTGGGNKEVWMAAAGIPRSEWVYVDSIVKRESGWNPCAYNPGKSDCNANPTSACGLAQSLPCGKQSKYGHWSDPVANLKWQYDYVTARYGGYRQAVAFWNANHWY